jgi:PAP2 superfamily
VCDCNIPPTPIYSTPVVVTYSPPATWDPQFDPANPAVGATPLILIPDEFKHRNNLLSPPAPIGSPAEFKQLFDYQTAERDKYCARICAQNISNMVHLFGAVLDYTGKGRTRLLIGAVESDLLQIVLFQKKLPNFNRARPYQIQPDLDPPFTPGHPSYPGGHSAQSHAVAGVIALILQRADSKYASLIAQCNDLAADIATNRERAGIHYPSDTAAGLRLADLYLQEALHSTKFMDNLNSARNEWP